MKKICIILPKLTAGGTERTAVELANYLANKNAKVTILLMFQQPRFFDVDKRVELIEPSNKYRSFLGRLLYIPYLIGFLRINIKKTKPDSVFLLGYILFGLTACLGLKTRVICSWRSSPNRIRFPNNVAANKVYKLLHYLLRKRLDGIIAQTTLSKEVYSKNYLCPIVVIPNFLREIKWYPKHEKGKVIINVGRLVNEKGQHFLLEAFAKLNHKDWKLWLVGDGPLREGLEQLSYDLKISDQVVFWGFQKDVDFYLSQASIFAFSSVIEGYPNALIEAMAHGLAPVSHNCEAGPSDIIKHIENGFLVETGNVDELALYLKRLIDDKDLRARIQENAKQVHINNDLITVCKLYEEFLFDLK